MAFFADSLPDRPPSDRAPPPHRSSSDRAPPPPLAPLPDENELLAAGPTGLAPLGGGSSSVAGSGAPTRKRGQLAPLPGRGSSPASAGRGPPPAFAKRGPPPASSAKRRELHRLLARARELDEKGETRRVELKPSSRETETTRWGAKIDGVYVMISATRDGDRLRFSVFDARAETRHGLVCRHADALEAGVGEVARAIALDLRFDETSRLVFGPHTPASWVSE